jgi:hypothetical protein
MVIVLKVEKTGGDLQEFRHQHGPGFAFISDCQFDY